MLIPKLINGAKNILIKFINESSKLQVFLFKIHTFVHNFYNSTLLENKLEAIEKKKLKNKREFKKYFIRIKIVANARL